MKKLIISIAIVSMMFATSANAAKTTYEREVAIDALIANAPAQQGRIEALEQRVASLESTKATLEARINELDGIVMTFQKQLLEIGKIVAGLFAKLLAR